MSEESLKEALPWDVRHHTFLKEGTWFLLDVNGTKVFAKFAKEEMEKLFAGDLAEAHHVMTASTQKANYLSASFGTSETWLIRGSHCGIIAPIHTAQALMMDAEIQDLISGKKHEEAAAPQIVKPGPKKLVLP